MAKPIATDVLAILGTLFRTGTVNPRVGPGVPGALGAYYMLTTDGTPFQKTGLADTDWTDISAVAGGSGSEGFYGTGGDGPQVLSAGTTTLARTMLYESLVVPNGAVLETDGWPVYVRTTLEVQPGGIIRSNGNAAVGATAGAQTWTPSARLLTGGRAGGDGQTGNGTGTAAAALSPEWLPTTNGQGGNGGAAGGGGGSGGSAGPNNPWSAGSPRYASLGPWLMSCYGCQPGASFKIGGGNGGGGGGGSGVGNAGGGGGGGGGMIFLAAFEMINNGTIEARGGAGAAGTGGNAGGGGGGGGGRIMLVRRTFEGTPPDVSGGAGGAPSGGGNAGSAGNAGYVFEYPD